MLRSGGGVVQMVLVNNQLLNLTGGSVYTSSTPLGMVTFSLSTPMSGLSVGQSIMYLVLSSLSAILFAIASARRVLFRSGTKSSGFGSTPVPSSSQLPGAWYCSGFCVMSFMLSCWVAIFVQHPSLRIHLGSLTCISE